MLGSNIRSPHQYFSLMTNILLLSVNNKYYIITWWPMLFEALVIQHNTFVEYPLPLNIFGTLLFAHCKSKKNHLITANLLLHSNWYLYHKLVFNQEFIFSLEIDILNPKLFIFLQKLIICPRKCYLFWKKLYKKLAIVGKILVFLANVLL